MISYNAQVVKGDYSVQFHTDNQKFYEEVEELLQLMIDLEIYRNEAKEQDSKHE